MRIQDDDDGEDLSHRLSQVVKVMAPQFKPKDGYADDPTLNPVFVGNYVIPRFTPGIWTGYMEVNTRLKTAIEGLAQIAVGKGVKGIPDPDELEFLDATDVSEVGRNNRIKLLEAARKVTAFCRRPKYGSFAQLEHELVQAEIDYQSNGNGCLEVIEANHEAGAPIYGVSHIRSAFCRINPMRTRWVQGIQAQSYDRDRASQIVFRGRYYRVFGDEAPERRFIDRFTGAFYSEWPKNIPEDRKGTAILHAKSYNPLDPYYGMPVHVPALNSILENDMLSQFMLAFTEGGMRVPVLVIVEGGNLTPESMEKVEAIFNSDARGNDGAGRAAVIQPTVAGNIGADTKIRVEKVDLGIKDMAPLFDRRSHNNGEILETVRMSGVFIGGAEGAQQTTRNAAVLKQLTYEHAIEPRTSFWEAVLSNGLAPRIAPGAVFKIRRSSNLDPLQQATLMTKLKDGLTTNDFRRGVQMLMEGVDLPILKVSPNNDIPFSILDSELELQNLKAAAALGGVQNDSPPSTQNCSGCFLLHKSS